MLRLPGTLLWHSPCVPLAICPEAKPPCACPQGASALFDMIEYYESATHLNISFNKHIGTRGWQAAAHMMRKVGTRPVSCPAPRPCAAPLLPSMALGKRPCRQPWLTHPGKARCRKEVELSGRGSPSQESGSSDAGPLCKVRVFAVMSDLAWPVPTRQAACSTWMPATHPCWTTRRPLSPAPCASAAAWRCCTWKMPACLGGPSCCWVSLRP